MSQHAGEDVLCHESHAKHFITQDHLPLPAKRADMVLMNSFETHCYTTAKQGQQHQFNVTNDWHSEGLCVCVCATSTKQQHQGVSLHGPLYLVRIDLVSDRTVECQALIQARVVADCYA